MPKHSEDANSYSMIVVTNKRPDGRYQYKVTLPKRLGDAAMSGKVQTTGEFSLAEIGYGTNDPTMVFKLEQFCNPPVAVQEEIMRAEWEPLTCPFCGDLATPPLFPESADPISHKLVHSCGSRYYADRSDTKSAREWELIKGTGKSWKIVHNYHVLLGKVAPNLSPDFDVNDGGTRLCHVMFLKPTSSSEIASTTDPAGD